MTNFFLQFLDCICICICVFVYFCISAKITELMMDHVSMQYNDRIQIRSILCVFFSTGDRLILTAVVGVGGSSPK